MSQSTKKALIILTSHTELGSTGRKTGFYYDEMATPYWRLIDAGFDVDIASVKGGVAPPDPKTLVEPNDRPPMVARFMSNDNAMAKLNNSYVLKELNGETYECVFLPGGHGTMWDFDTKDIGKIISDAWASGAVVGAVCHGPSGLLQAVRSNGEPLVKDLKVNCFTDAETDQIGLTGIEPFLLENRLRELGAKFECGKNFTSHAVRDGRLVTGQNPQSTEAVSKLLIEAVNDTMQEK
ncbi:type 1 glutamine amidotransferase domain-containing protein [Amylibacter sp.]|nr:type 1 glutamine amidotransferase domain-containing protein [Amylibacter sp.]